MQHFDAMEIKAFFPSKTLTNISIFKQYTLLSTKLLLQRPQTAIFRICSSKTPVFSGERAGAGRGQGFGEKGRSLAAAGELVFP